MEIYKKAAPYIIIGSLCSMAGYASYTLYSKFNKYYKLYNLLNEVETPKESVTIEDNHMIIHYNYLNSNYTVRIPFSHTQVVPMTQYRVVGVRENGEEIDLTQQPGVPYLVLPQDLNFTHMVVYDYDLDETRNYTIPPFYGL